MITQDYKKQTILLTGAASGIGLAQLNTYLDAGATVIAIDKQPIPVTNDRLTPYQLDLSDMTQLGEWIASHNDELSIVDIFLSTAGVLDAFTPALDTDFTAIQQLMNVNVNAAVQLNGVHGLNRRSNCWWWRGSLHDVKARLSRLDETISFRLC